MFLQLFWLVFLSLAWYKLVSMFPTHQLFINLVMGLALALQVLMFVITWRDRQKARAAAQALQQTIKDAQHDLLPGDGVFPEYNKPYYSPRSKRRLNDLQAPNTPHLDPDL